MENKTAVIDSRSTPLLQETISNNFRRCWCVREEKLSDGNLPIQAGLSSVSTFLREPYIQICTHASALYLASLQVLAMKTNLIQNVSSQ